MTLKWPDFYLPPINLWVVPNLYCKYIDAKPYLYCKNGTWFCENKYKVLTGIGKTPKEAYDTWFKINR
jgi:hypothetical protein